MINENKLPKITNRYIFEDKKYTCVGIYISHDDEYDCESFFEMFRDGADFAKRYELEDFDKFKEIPEQEPTVRENRTVDARKKVDKVQEAKEGLKWQIKNDGWSDDKQHRERLMYFSQNLINALDAQEIAGSKLSKTVTLAGKSDENVAEVAKSKSIWKPTLISKPQLIKGSQHVMIRVPNKTIELVNYIDQGSLCGFRDLSNNDIQNRHIIEYCTLTDFVDQIQDNTDRLDKLETKLNK